MRKRETQAAVVGVSGEDRDGAVELLEQHDAHELMRPGGGAEREPELGALRAGLARGRRRRR